MSLVYSDQRHASSGQRHAESITASPESLTRVIRRASFEFGPAHRLEQALDSLADHSASSDTGFTSTLVLRRRLSRHSPSQPPLPLRCRQPGLPGTSIARQSVRAAVAPLVSASRWPAFDRKGFQAPGRKYTRMCTARAGRALPIALAHGGSRLLRRGGTRVAGR